MIGRTLERIFIEAERRIASGELTPIRRNTMNTA